MRKVILPLLLLPVLAQAATWTKIASGGASESYVDKGSMIKADRGYKVWSLVSFAREQATPDGKAYMSMKELHLYSCAERTTTLQSQVYYGEAMGKGAPVQSFKYEKFTPEDIVPDSVADGALQLICRAKK